jgi:hypothetical protein
VRTHRKQCTPKCHIHRTEEKEEEEADDDEEKTDPLNLSALRSTFTTSFTPLLSILEAAARFTTLYSFFCSFFSASGTAIILNAPISSPASSPPSSIVGGRKCVKRKKEKKKKRRKKSRLQVLRLRLLLLNITAVLLQLKNVCEEGSEAREPRPYLSHGGVMERVP